LINALARSSRYVAEEAANTVGDLNCVCFECEMAGVEQVHLSIWIVSAEGLGAGRQEEGIVPAPDLTEYVKFRW
jgi:hypothetical protein